MGTRPVSANTRDKQPFPVGPGSPLDLQGEYHDSATCSVLAVPAVKKAGVAYSCACCADWRQVYIPHRNLILVGGGVGFYFSRSGCIVLDHTWRLAY